MCGCGAYVYVRGRLNGHPLITQFPQSLIESRDNHLVSMDTHTFTDLHTQYVHALTVQCSINRENF